MKPEAIRKLEEEDEDEEFVGLNVDQTLLESVQILFKTEPEVEIFYDGLLERFENNKRLRKNPDNREENNKQFLDELLKYHTIEEINQVITSIKQPELKKQKNTNKTSKDEQNIDKILKETFNKPNEFKEFIALVSQNMMENNDSPVSATAKAMKKLNKTDEETLKVTEIIDKIF